MKKVLCVVAAMLMLLTMASMMVSAAPADDIVSAAKKYIPAKYEAQYLITLENVLSQITVTQEQADQVVACIEAAAAAIPEDLGGSLSLYPADQVTAVMEQFDKACTILNLTYKMESTNKYHEGDVDVVIYGPDGKALCALDGDVVKRTDVDGVDYTGFALAGAALALALAAAVVFSRKALAARS